MRIAILGGGFTGLTAAHTLTTKEREVSLFEKENILGGLATGFKSDGWDWYLERTYHHMFSNDEAILSFAEEIGWKGIVFDSPLTSSLYEYQSKLIQFPLDTPFDLLKLSLLSLPERLRVGMVLAFLKYGPFLSLYERESTLDLLRKTMGRKAADIFIEQMLRKKFGKYADKIIASFIWARITKRTKKLAYIEGGFQSFINYIAASCEKKGVSINRGTQVISVIRTQNGFTIEWIKDGKKYNGIFDKIISTLPTPIAAKLFTNILDPNTIERWNHIHYLAATNLILETEKPLLNATYWLSICVPRMPMMVVVQHTNFMDKKYYGGRHITYIGNYMETSDPLFRMDTPAALEFFSPHLEAITPGFMKQQIKPYYLKAAFAQPIFDKEFVHRKPDFITEVPGLYIANLDMTYPYDRGTNFAVSLGKKVASLITSSL